MAASVHRPPAVLAGMPHDASIGRPHRVRIIPAVRGQPGEILAVRVNGEDIVVVLVVIRRLLYPSCEEDGHPVQRQLQQIIPLGGQPAGIASLKVHNAQPLWDIGPHSVHKVAPIVRVAGKAAVS